MTSRWIRGLPAVLLLAGFAWAPERPEEFEFQLELRQIMRSTADDAPVEGQDWVRTIQATFRAEVEPAGDGSAVIWLAIRKFKLKQRIGDNDVAPLGADKMRELKLVLPLDARGPAGDLRLGDQTDLDASNWSVMQPLSEALRHGLGLALPILAEPGAAWTVTRRVPLGLPGAPDLEMEIVSAYVVTGTARCGKHRCARIEEVISAQFSDYRPLGGTLVLVELEGVGQASHLFSIDENLPLEVDGQVRLTVHLDTQTVPGLPLYGTVTELSSHYSLRR